MRKALYFSISGLLIIGFGIFMWAKPNTFMNILAFAFAIYILFEGIKGLILYFRIKGRASKALRMSMLVKALMNVAISVITLIVASINREAILNIVVYLFAANFILSSLVDLAEYMMVKRAKLEGIFSSLTLQAALGLLFGILFIIFPQFIGKASLVIIAVIIIAIGIITTSYGIHAYLLDKALKSYAKENHAEAEFVNISADEEK